MNTPNRILFAIIDGGGTVPADIRHPGDRRTRS